MRSLERDDASGSLPGGLLLLRPRLSQVLAKGGTRRRGLAVRIATLPAKQTVRTAQHRRCAGAAAPPSEVPGTRARSGIRRSRNAERGAEPRPALGAEGTPPRHLR